MKALALQDSILGTISKNKIYDVKSIGKDGGMW